MIVRERGGREERRREGRDGERKVRRESDNEGETREWRTKGVWKERREKYHLGSTRRGSL